VGVAGASAGGSTVVLLSGGTGGAKLARGLRDVVGDAALAVIANTGDDIDIYGAHVSPDPDLITFWLADLIDERGWGLRGDTFNVMDALRALGADVWFNLGDRDLAWCLERRRMEEAGATPTQALAHLCGRIGVGARVLPMTDDAARTLVNGRPLQEFLIRGGGEGPIRDVSFGDAQAAAGADGARPTPAVESALADARAVIVGPSNPVISIAPILSVIGDLLARTAAPVVAVSPIVGGEVLKGPTDAFLEAAGVPTSAAGVAAYYEHHWEGLLDGMVADEPVAAGMAELRTDTRMDDPAARARVAGEVLEFAESLSAAPLPGQRRVG
jgi:LPPG:FO 2-phospho-L-lactate transferase